MVVGKQLSLDRKTPYIIRGVFETLPENTDIPFEVVVSMNELWNRERAGWGFDISYTVITRFRNPAQDIPVVEARLPELIKEYMPNFNKKSNDRWAFSFRPLTDFHTQNSTVRTMILVMTILGIAILLVAAFNYVLISVSSLARRSKEVGVHKCSGASDGTIFGMFLTETVIIVLISVALSALLMYLFRDFVEDIAAAKLLSLFTVHTLWVPALVILLVFLLAGVLPAWLFSSIPVSQVFRRYTEHNASWKRPLLFIQFMGASFIFCFLLVVLHQCQSVMNRPLGYDPTRVVTCWTNVGGSYENRVSLFGSLPMVEEYTCSSQLICEGYSGNTYSVSADRKVNVRMDWVVRNFIPMMKINLIEGHNLTPEKTRSDGWTDNDEVIVNEAFVRQAGWTDSAVGHQIMEGKTAYRVVGVMENYPVYSAYEAQTPVILFLKEDWGKNALFAPERTFQ